MSCFTIFYLLPPLRAPPPEKPPPRLPPNEPPLIEPLERLPPNDLELLKLLEERVEVLLREKLLLVFWRSYHLFTVDVVLPAFLAPLLMRSRVEMSDEKVRLDVRLKLEVELERRLVPFGSEPND